MRVGFLTAGGIAPCLSASIGHLIKNYSEKDKSIEMLGYLYGYKGLLLGNSINISKDIINSYEILYGFGGTPLGNSRVKLSNIEDCIKNKFINKGENPLEIAAKHILFILSKIILPVPSKNFPFFSQSVKSIVSLIR